MTILNHKLFQQHVLNELCAQVVKTRTKHCEELQNFVRNGCEQLKIQICIDKIDVADVLMQCEAFKYNDKEPCKILVNQLVNAREEFSL